MKIHTLILLLLAWFLIIAPVGAAVVTNRSSATETTIILPEPIPDPLERVNRGLWAVNEAAMRGVVKPSGKVYRFLVPIPFRIGISNVGKNLAFPRRVLNNVLQERWTGARDESYRFLANTVLGMGGFLDVASELRIPLSEADAAQTLGKWGWGQNFYLMLPIAGPSSDREAAGAVVDWASNPLTYFSPYNYIPSGVTYNNLTDAVDAYVRRVDSEMDPYSLLRYGSALQRKQRAVDLTLSGEQHAPTLETMQFALFGVRDVRFPERGYTREVKLSSTGRFLPYTAWVQRKPAPIIYLLPGIGAHRLNGGAMGLAELLYEKGFSVVTISSPFNFEFIDRALSADLPGYSPADVQDIHLALTQIDRDLVRFYPGQLGKRALMGYSLGGFHTLMLATSAHESRSFLQFDRYLSIDAPVHLLRGVEQLDSFYSAALDWPAAERTDRIEQLLVKVAALARLDASPQSVIPLNATESKFLIGLVFRFNLRDTIFFTQMRHNQGVLKEPLDKWKREPAYREIMNYSFADYVNIFLQQHYLKRGIDLQSPEILARAVDLRTFETAYRTQSSIRAIANADDILLNAEDVAWLSNTFGERITLFPRGGHLGNLGETAVQAAILSHLSDLHEGPAGRDVISRGAKSVRQSPKDYAARGSRAGF